MNNEQRSLTQPSEQAEADGVKTPGTSQVDPAPALLQENGHGVVVQGLTSSNADSAPKPMPYLAVGAVGASPAIRFLWQRWRESLDTLAPVSVRARTTGPRELLRELKEIDALIARSNVGQGDRTAVLEEAFGIKANGVSVAGVLVTDPVVVNTAKHLLEEWSVANSGFLSSSQPTEVEAGRRTAVSRQLEHHLNKTYRAHLFALLEDAAFPADAGVLSDEQMQKLDTLVAALVTDLLTDGFSAYFLRVRGELAEKSMTHTPETGRDALREFFSRFLRPPEKTTVVVKAKASKEFWKAWPACSERETGETLGSVLVGDYTERWSRKTRRQFSDTPSGGIRFVVWVVVAHDRGHAARLAYQAFERVGDAICFIEPGVSPAQLEAVATIRHGDPTVLEAVTKRDAEFTFRPLRTSLSDIRGRRPNLASVALGEDSSSPAARRLTGALRAQRIAREENWLESGLTTLWTAIETLAYERYAGSIIDSVVRSVVPFVCSTKMKDLADDLSVYLNWSGVTEDPSFKAEFADLLNEWAIVPHELIRALAIEERAKRLAELSSESPLLQYRIRRFHEVARSGKDVVLRTCQSAKRVDWQLRRVYRLRNGIIHGAKFTGTGEQLLEHLDSYVRAVLGPLSQILTANNGIQSVEEAVAAVDARFEAWRQWALGIKKAPTTGEAIRLYTPPYTELWEA